MYALVSQIQNVPIISLQSGESVGWLGRPIIDLTALEIVAFFCESANHKQQLVLLARDIRQLAQDCAIIDNEDELSQPEDIVRLEPVITEAYTPLGKRVVSDTGRKVGSVEDYSINLESSRIQKLYVRQSSFRAWLGTNLIIDRTQILDVTPRRITVRDATVTSPIIAKTIPDVQP